MSPCVLHRLILTRKAWQKRKEEHQEMSSKALVACQAHG